MKILRTALLLVSGLFGVASLAQEARLSNLAIRAQGGGGDVLITGFTVGAGPNKTVLIRAVGPTLGAFGVGGALADPKLELFSGSTKIAENDNWRELDATAFSAVGAFPLGAGSKDAALLAELAPGSYTAQVSGVGAGAGVTLVEVYEVSGGATRLVNLSTRAQVGTGGNILIPGLTIAPGAGARRLLVRAVGPTLGSFGVPGVLADPKLELYSGSNKTAENDNWGTPVGNGAATAEQLGAAFSAAGAFALAAGGRDAAMLVNLTPGSYTLQVSGVGNTTGAALVEVYDLTPPPPTTTLYVAQLRPEAGATGSTASGYATVLVSEDGTSATVTVSFSNLTSAQTGAHLKIGSDFVLNLPLGQVAGRAWTFTAVGTYSSVDLINALKSGNLTVGLDSAKFPAGEVRGAFLLGAGSQVFAAPAAVPTPVLTSPTATDAARLLMQATFGPTTATINTVMSRGISGWIDDQMAAPPTSALAALRADINTYPLPDLTATGGSPRYAWTANWNAAWWKTAMSAPDQLRQRVAFALSEILVVGEQDDLRFNLEAKMRYYDLLVGGAFGNFRQLIEDVTLNPAMGFWLSHRGNIKANPTKGTAPDENYAREVQQLFTIGLVQLQPDGTLLLDATGQPIPTYNQTMISETAKILTGWTYAEQAANNTVESKFTYNLPGGQKYPAQLPDDQAWLVPMRYYDAFHDKTVKTIVSVQQVPPADAAPTVVPANQTGPQDLKILLDTLVNHPNTGPFISKQLIQRLVTSNPSASYVYRVAQVFANDGAGVRGNLGAVVRAILTDYEARSPAVLNNFGYGKAREPLLRMTAFLRAMNAAAPSGRYLDSFFTTPVAPALAFYPGGFFSGPDFFIGQAPMGSSTVFNFFSPTYSPPGAMAAAGLVAPELEITDSNYAIQAPNQLTNLMYRTVATLPAPPSGPSPYIVLDYAAYLPNARNATALVDQMNLLFCAGQMTSATRAQIISTLGTLPAASTDLERVQTALQFTVTSPDSAIQR